jgi:hypothetical protein
MRVSAVWSALAVLTLAPIASVGAQTRREVSFPIGLHVGLPQGPFADNVNVAGGLMGGAIFPMASELGFRAELGFSIYGSESRRVPLGGGALGVINVDVTTTNAILGGNIGLQVGIPGPSFKPYLGGMIGFSAFTTSSSVAGSNSADEPFASSQNSADVAFSQTVLGGLYLPLWSQTALVDLGVRYTWNGKEVKYLTRGDIAEGPSGEIILSPRRTRADLLTVVLGVTIRKPAK